MQFFKELNKEINTNPYYTVVASICGGILFSGISWGIFYVILFLIFWEILYIGYLDVNGKKWDLLDRLNIVLGAFLGYLIGANLLNKDDHYKSIKNFKDDIKYYGEQFSWFD